MNMHVLEFSWKARGSGSESKSALSWSSMAWANFEVKVEAYIFLLKNQIEADITRVLFGMISWLWEIQTQFFKNKIQARFFKKIKSKHGFQLRKLKTWTCHLVGIAIESLSRMPLHMLDILGPVWFSSTSCTRKFWSLITGIKWRQFVKLISQPCATPRDESNEAFDARLENGYCSITVANHGLITVIRFVAQNCTHPWKGFANKFRLVLHAYKILFYST